MVPIVGIGIVGAGAVVAYLATRDDTETTGAPVSSSNPRAQDDSPGAVTTPTDRGARVATVGKIPTSSKPPHTRSRDRVRAIGRVVGRRLASGRWTGAGAAGAVGGGASGNTFANAVKNEWREQDAGSIRGVVRTTTSSSNPAEPYDPDYYR